jgi:ribosomal protein L15E
MESRKTELCNKLYKTEEEQQIFLGFRFLKQEHKKIANKAKYFWIFQISNQKQQVKQTKARKLKRQTKRNNGNIFGLFAFWKVEIRTRTIEKRKRNMDIQSTDKI